jgi:GAF domain-containing protein
MPRSTAREGVAGQLATFLDDQAVRSHEQLGDVAGVAVTVALDEVPVTVGASTELAREVDQTQYEIGRGPCLHALTTGEGLYVRDLANDERWGDYGPKAAALGAACCLSLPIRSDAGSVGVFKVYASEVDGLTEDQRSLGDTIAQQLTGGLGLAQLLATQAEELDDRTAAMDQRRQIDLAVGIVMERHHCSATEAFERLRRQSNDTNMKLRDAAAAMLASRGPGPGPAPFRPKSRRRPA